MSVDSLKHRFWAFVKRETPALLLKHGGVFNKDDSRRWFEQNYDGELPLDIKNAYGHAFRELYNEGVTEKTQGSSVYKLTERHMAKLLAEQVIEAAPLVEDGATTEELLADAEDFTVESIIRDGSFLERKEVEQCLERLRTKKNLILQGPPGTGKTWLAKRLAFALIGQEDETKVRAVQFHPNLSYEDFVRGWRPTGEGKLSLADGIFMESIKAAIKEPLSKFVVVIEEINRGNPAQIFGELLTLLEADKRKPKEALELCYPNADGDRRVHIPENLYVIGTMNIADRSLALVDLALRRRFAFVGLEPKLGHVWRDWVVRECNIDPRLVADIERRINVLNDQIAEDSRLGRQFRIGQSYVTPTNRLETGGTNQWFRQVVETEIGPLLEEYWFDAPDAAEDARKRLIQDW